jgi:hypothetical protein
MTPERFTADVNYGRVHAFTLRGSTLTADCGQTWRGVVPVAGSGHYLADEHGARIERHAIRPTCKRCKAGAS